MDDFISRKEFIEQKRKLYCENCSRRKDSKGKAVYEIGDAPCRSCGIGDVLDDLDDFQAADVRPVVLCRDCAHSRKGKQSLECEKHIYAWNNLNRLVNDDDFCSWGVKREES